MATVMELLLHRILQISLALNMTETNSRMNFKPNRRSYGNLCLFSSGTNSCTHLQYFCSVIVATKVTLYLTSWVTTSFNDIFCVNSTLTFFSLNSKTQHDVIFGNSLEIFDCTTGNVLFFRCPGCDDILPC